MSETENLKRVLHLLSGALFRLRKKKYLVERKNLDNDEEMDMQNLLFILDNAMIEVRKIISGKS